MGVTVVKRAWRSGPVTCVFSSGLGLTVFRIFLAAAGSRRCVGGVKLERPQPRSGEDERAGRRRTAADHRERGRVPFVLVAGGRWCSWRVVGGVVSQAPIRRLAM